MDVGAARSLAFQLLAEELPGRWGHVQGVAQRAGLFAPRVADPDLLVAAGYLHDIGYAAALVDVGFHQIDGARYLRANGWDERVVNLVAHHSGAAVRAEFQGLSGLYDEFPLDESLPHRELHVCDLAIDVDGRAVDLDGRLAGMRRRHGTNPAMLRYLDLYEGDMRRLVGEFEFEPGPAVNDSEAAPAETAA